MSNDTVSSAELIDATRQLAVLTRLGFPVADGLRTLATGGSRWLGRVALTVEAGDTLAEATARHPLIFSPFYVGMVQAAEASGHPSDVLASLGHWLERSDMLLAKARTTLYYPLLLLNAAIMQVVLIVMVVLPSALSPLANITGYGAAAQSASKLQTPLVGVVFVIVLVMMNVTALRPATVVTLVSRVPGLGPLQYLAQQGLWAQALGSLLGAGVPLSAALRQSTSVVTEPKLLAILNRVPDLVDKGDTLSDALVSLPHLSPCLAWSVTAGERQEDLAPLLLDASAYIDRDVDIRTQHALRTFEPWVQCAVGVVVCSAMLVFWMPYYHLVSSIR